tara:strand:- start:5177 stop:5404 length:228 start_codon:yes stop_codon:yes gene_type:complete
MNGMRTLERLLKGNSIHPNYEELVFSHHINVGAQATKLHAIDNTSSFVYAVFHASIGTRGFVAVLDPDYTRFILQ